MIFVDNKVKQRMFTFKSALYKIVRKYAQVVIIIVLPNKNETHENTNACLYRNKGVCQPHGGNEIKRKTLPFHYEAMVNESDNGTEYTIQSLTSTASMHSSSSVKSTDKYLTSFNTLSVFGTKPIDITSSEANGSENISSK